MIFFLLGIFSPKVFPKCWQGRHRSRCRGTQSLGFCTGQRFCPWSFQCFSWFPLLFVWWLRAISKLHARNSDATRPGCRVCGEGRGSTHAFLRSKKRPEPILVGSGRTKSCPWFHLNSPLEAGHFVPGNGGVRRSISAPRLQGAIRCFPEELTPTAPSLKPDPAELPCHSLSPGHCITVFEHCQGK